MSTTLVPLTTTIIPPTTSSSAKSFNDESGSSTSLFVFEGLMVLIWAFSFYFLRSRKNMLLRKQQQRYRRLAESEGLDDEPPEFKEYIIGTSSGQTGADRSTTAVGGSGLTSASTPSSMQGAATQVHVRSNSTGTGGGVQQGIEEFPRTPTV